MHEGWHIFFYLSSFDLKCIFIGSLLETSILHHPHRAWSPVGILEPVRDFLTMTEQVLLSMKKEARNSYRVSLLHFVTQRSKNTISLIRMSPYRIMPVRPELLDKLLLRCIVARAKQIDGSKSATCWSESITTILSVLLFFRTCTLIIPLQHPVKNWLDVPPCLKDEVKFILISRILWIE